MARATHRLNVTLDPEHAARLTRLAQQTHLQEGTLARSLLSNALEQVDPDADNVARLLDGIPGSHERALLGLKRARQGDTVGLDDL